MKESFYLAWKAADGYPVSSWIFLASIWSATPQKLKASRNGRSSAGLLLASTTVKKGFFMRMRFPLLPYQLSRSANIWYAGITTSLVLTVGKTIILLEDSNQQVRLTVNKLPE